MCNSADRVPVRDQGRQPAQARDLRGGVDAAAVISQRLNRLVATFPCAQGIDTEAGHAGGRADRIVRDTPWHYSRPVKIVTALTLPTPSTASHTTPIAAVPATMVKDWRVMMSIVCHGQIIDNRMAPLLKSTPC